MYQGRWRPPDGLDGVLEDAHRETLARASAMTLGVVIGFGDGGIRGPGQSAIRCGSWLERISAGPRRPE